jgi:hypothetical protein
VVVVSRELWPFVVVLDTRFRIAYRCCLTYNRLSKQTLLRFTLDMWRICFIYRFLLESVDLSSSFLLFWFVEVGFLSRLFTLFLFFSAL